MKIEKEKKRIRELPVATKAGYALGGMANDFVSNASRSLWWLLNAPQVIPELAAEAGVAAVNPDLYREESIGLEQQSKTGLSVTPLISTVLLSPVRRSVVVVQRLSHCQTSQVKPPTLVVTQAKPKQQTGRKSRSSLRTRCTKG